MSQIFKLSLALLMGSVYAAQGLQWQSLIQSQSSGAISDREVKVQFVIKDSTASQYTETQLLTTASNGYVQAVIGEGLSSDQLDSVDWSQSDLQLEVSVDEDNDGSYDQVSSAPLYAVPYAMYAANSQPGPAGPAGAQGQEGPQGLGIARAEIIAGELVITYQDSTQDTAGVIAQPIAQAVQSPFVVENDTLKLDTTGVAEGDILYFQAGQWVNKNLAYTNNTGGGQSFSIMQPYLAVNYIIALQGTFPSRSFEPFLAQISLFGSNFAPRGWALCDGQLLPISSNSALFSLLGTTYGGDGRTNFALPDLRGRVPIHAGDGPGLSSRRLGQRGGTETVILNTTQIPSHRHTIP